MKGLYKKYNITKTSGKPLDPNFYAIVLRIDGGQYVGACRAGVKAFAEAVQRKNPELSFDIDMKLLDYSLRDKAKAQLAKVRDRTELHEWGSPKGLPKGWRGRIMKGSKIPDRPDKRAVALQYCKWCPNDCQGLSDEEKTCCLAAGGFADEFALFTVRDRPDREKVIRVILLWQNEDTRTGGQNPAVLADQISALYPDIEQIGKQPTCGLCGGKMSKNPHPDAGKPDSYLEVGTVNVCIPCTVKSRHAWAERVYEAKREERERILNWGIEICHEHLPKWEGRVDLMGGVQSRRECPKCWQALKEEK